MISIQVSLSSLVRLIEISFITSLKIGSMELLETDKSRFIVLKPL